MPASAVLSMCVVIAVMTAPVSETHRRYPRTGRVRGNCYPRTRTLRGRSHSYSRRHTAGECFGDQALVPRTIRSGASPHDWTVAIGIIGSGHVGTIALEECGRGAALRTALPQAGAGALTLAFTRVRKRTNPR